MELKYDQLYALFKTALPIKIFRMKDPALMVSFLHKIFKQSQEFRVEYDVFIHELADYLEMVADDNESDEEGLIFYDDRAKELLEKWIADEYLINNIDDTTGKVYISLTQSIEKTFMIVESLIQREFVGTESKFMDIFHKLHQLVDDSIEDKESKIEDLKAKRDKIDQQIRLIEESGKVQILEDFQVKSRLNDLNRLVNELTGDFREVEDNFKKITRSIFEYQETQLHSKGSIMNLTFDAIDALKDDDQGKSFYAFWDFLIDEDSKDELQNLIEKTYEILKERGIDEKGLALKSIKNILYNSGLRIMDNNRVLSDRLSRMISERRTESNKKLRETLSEIQASIIRNINDDDAPRPSFILEDRTSINMIMDRSLELSREEIVIENEIDIYDNDNIDIESLSSIFSHNTFDLNKLRERIKTYLIEKDRVSLEEIIKETPIEQGLNEVMGYLSVVKSFKYSVVDQNKRIYILFDSTNERRVEVPNIIYSN